ncbi:MAG TPA: hypothetical protein VLJ59_09025 [Mycobacteriales bacterium]|nr:hypothetical protein [Mycobacteriales bacterium]
MTKNFLLVLDRSAGRLLSLVEHPTRAGALQARFDTEKQHRQDPSIEVVVLTAASEQALRRTHARYFDDVRQMASGGLRHVPEARPVADRAVRRTAPGFAG